MSISNHALEAIAGYAAGSIDGVNQPGKINIHVVQEGIVTIDIAPVLTYGYPLHIIAAEIQKNHSCCGEMTGLQVQMVNVQVKGLSLDKKFVSKATV